MNSNLLKEAIADAKAVRATALANAKASLEEAFNNRFSAVFADKLREDSAIESQSTDETPVAETVEPKDATPSKSDGTKPWSKDNRGNWGPTDKNMTPDKVAAAKDGGDATKGWSKDNKGNAMDGTPNGIKEAATEEAVEEESVEETVTNEDLDEIIRELEAEAGASPMDSAGPAPGGDLGAEAPPMDAGNEPPAEESQEIKAGDTVTFTGTVTKAPPEGEMPGAESPVGDVPPSPGGEEAPPMEEEDIDLNELLASLNEEAKEEKGEKEEEEKGEKEEVDETLTTQLNEAISQRNEAYRTVEYLQKQINEINLLNAKLLYTNKLFKEFGMNRDQKTQIVEAFDLTKNVREVKLTYANWCSSLNFGGKAQRKQVSVPGVTTISEGFSSKAVSSTKPAAIITENVNEQARRFQKLAGINVKK